MKIHQATKVLSCAVMSAGVFTARAEIYGMPVVVPQQQIYCPIWAPPDPTAAAVNKACADSARLVNELNAQLGVSTTGKSDHQRLTEILNRVYSEKDPEKLRQMAARAEVIGRMADSEAQAALRERERLAWEARNRADQEFRNATGRDFSQTMRPSSPGAYQDAWDKCNRTHQIWD